MRQPMQAPSRRTLIPFERSFTPFIYEADGQNGKEDHHRPVTEQTEVTERYSPGKQEAHFKVEDDEKYRHEIVPHVELHSRVIEGVEPAFVSGKLLGIRLPVRDQKGRQQDDSTDRDGNRNEDYERKVGVEQHLV